LAAASKAELDLAVDALVRSIATVARYQFIVPLEAKRMVFWAVYFLFPAGLAKYLTFFGSGQLNFAASTYICILINFCLHPSSILFWTFRSKHSDFQPLE
jgi:hypothetical protein